MLAELTSGFYLSIRNMQSLYSHTDSTCPGLVPSKITHFERRFTTVLCSFHELTHTVVLCEKSDTKRLKVRKQSYNIYQINELGFLPDKPLKGSGSLSDWIGRAGDLSREAAPVCSHAQLRTHSKERSARGTSIPNLPLFPSLLEIFPSILRLRVF